MRIFGTVFELCKSIFYGGEELKFQPPRISGTRWNGVLTIWKNIFPSFSKPKRLVVVFSTPRRNDTSLRVKQLSKALGNRVAQNHETADSIGRRTTRKKGGENSELASSGS